MDREYLRQRKQLGSSNDKVGSGKGQKFSLVCIECSEGGGGRERQVVAGELIKSSTRKDLNEQCWNFIIKATGSL